jgi:phenylalanyl-tRNA synthetase beta chain
MKVSLNWLKRYVDLPKDLTPSELALRLTMATVEVEEFEDLGAGFDQIVVGQIKEIVPHPDADKLRVCQVDVGEQQRRTIVCGGSNLETGMFCVVALPGARVRWHGQGEAVELGEAKIRGVASAGMICAASEVGLEDFYPPRAKRKLLIWVIMIGWLASLWRRPLVLLTLFLLLIINPLPTGRISGGTTGWLGKLPRFLI